MPCDSEDTPPYGVGALGVIQLLRDKATIPDDEPTGEYCPACAVHEDNGSTLPGDGVVRHQDKGGVHSASQCTLCRGNGWCSAANATNWRIRNIASGKR